MAALISDQRPSGARNVEATWQGLPTDLLLRILSGLPPNELACTARLVCKAAAAGLSSPQQRTVRLSQPSPHGEFVRRWGGPGAMRPLTLARRRLLLSLTAASGCLDNLEWLAERAGCSLTAEVLEAAAAAGRLGVCQWLKQEGCDVRPGRTLLVAAGAGQQAVVEWLLAIEDTNDGDKNRAISSAARSGHVGLVDWLLERFELGDGAWMGVLKSAAFGCDLPTLQWLLGTYLQGEPDVHLCSRMVPAASCSRTPDWKAKVEWLEEKLAEQGRFLKTAGACTKVANFPDALERLTWLRGRGYWWNGGAAWAVAKAGNLGALRYLLAEGCPVEGGALREAAAAGQLAVLQALHAHGTAFTPAAWSDAIGSAARGGHLPAVAWLLEAGLVPLEWLQQHGAKMLEAAARVGSMELLAWLRERGCSWDGATIAAAAEAGSEEVLEWLVAQGCPVQAPEDEYVNDPYARAARKGDWSTLACLHRLGCPFDCLGHQTFLYAVGGGCCVPALRRLLELGCPVDWERAAALAPKGRGAIVREWVKEQHLEQHLARGGEWTDCDSDDDDFGDADSEEDEDDSTEEETEEAGEEEEAAPDAAEVELGQ